MYSVLCYSFLNIFWLCTHFLASTLLSTCTLLFVGCSVVSEANRTTHTLLFTWKIPCPPLFQYPLSRVPAGLYGTLLLIPVIVTKEKDGLTLFGQTLTGQKISFSYYDLFCNSTSSLHAIPLSSAKKIDYIIHKCQCRLSEEYIIIGDYKKGSIRQVYVKVDLIFTLKKILALKVQFAALSVQLFKNKAKYVLYLTMVLFLFLL